MRGGTVTPFSRVRVVFELCDVVQLCLKGSHCTCDAHPRVCTGVVPAYNGDGARFGSHLREYADGRRVCPGEDSRLQVLRALFAASGTAQQAGQTETSRTRTTLSVSAVTTKISSMCCLSERQ